MKYIILSFLALSLFLSKLQAQTPADTLSFPTDFILKTADFPKGFAPEPLPKGAAEAGFPKNPGILDLKFVRNIYNDADLGKIEKAYGAIFIPSADLSKEDVQEMGYDVIAYHSAADLKQEIKKFRQYSGAHYLIKDRFFIKVWGDAGSFQQEVDALAAHFKNKLKMMEFTPIDDTSTPTAVTQPAEK